MLFKERQRQVAVRFCYFFMLILNIFSYDEVSAEFVDQFCSIFSNFDLCSSFEWITESIVWATNVFLTCSSNAFMPIDQIFKFLTNVADSEFLIASTVATFPILSMLSQMEEERILLRCEALIDDPIKKLAESVIYCLSRMLNEIIENDYLELNGLEILKNHIGYACKLIIYFIREFFNDLFVLTNFLGAKNKIGNYIEENLSKYINCEAVECCKNKLGFAFFPVMLVLIEVKDPEVVEMMCVGKYQFAEDRKRIQHLTADIVRNSYLREKFTEVQLLTMLELNDYGLYLMKNDPKQCEFLKELSENCLSIMIHQQFEYLHHFGIDKMIRPFVEYLKFYERYGLDIPEFLKEFLPKNDNDEYIYLTVEKKIFLSNFTKANENVQDIFLKHLTTCSKMAKNEKEIQALASSFLLLDSESMTNLILSIVSFINYKIFMIYNCFSLKIGANVFFKKFLRF